MSQSTLDIARRRRAELISRLGGCCHRCGAGHALEFDHIHPSSRHWSRRRAGFIGATYRYLRDASKGLLSLLCSRCNHDKQAVLDTRLRRRSMPAARRLFRAWLDSGTRCEHAPF